tara:strand:- start:8972 stop:9250 length:279 start_codon:yes stop_codon:yes gene_type:complete
MLKNYFFYIELTLNNNWQDILPYNPETKLRELQKTPEVKDHQGQDIVRMIIKVRFFSGNSFWGRLHLTITNLYLQERVMLNIQSTNLNKFLC